MAFWVMSFFMTANLGPFFAFPISLIAQQNNLRYGYSYSERKSFKAFWGFRSIATLESNGNSISRKQFGYICRESDQTDEEGARQAQRSPVNRVNVRIISPNLGFLLQKKKYCFMLQKLDSFKIESVG